MKILTITLAAILVFSATDKGGTRMSVDEWKGIRPLKSTRAEVEKVLGAPLERDCQECIYKSETERVAVTYSRGPCKAGEGWNVPKDTVLNFTLYPERDQKLDKTTLKSELMFHISRETFVLQDRGVAYTLDELTHSVKRVSYVPKESDNDLRCPGFPRHNPAGSMYTPSTAFTRDDALSNLDVLVTESLVRPPEFVIYVVVYAGRQMPPSEYDKLFKSYERHLYERRGASRQKIKLIKGERRETFTANVFYLRKDDPPPVP
jgi:hypothetical protein